MAGAINELKDQLGFCRSNGDWEEESRCLNALASRYKAAGHYVKAIQFLEEDYRMLKKRKLSDKEKLDLLLPSVQSLGELHNGRGNYELGLRFQNEHRNMALALSHLDPSCRELQRAECQLGVAYMDMADREREDPQKSESLKKLAKQHLTEALQLASANNLQKALVDAYNNLALLAMQTDDLTLAMSHLTKGLRLCDNLYPDSEARLHHALGMLFSKQGNKREATKHIRKDIEICHQIKHLQGEGKAFLTLGDLHCKFHSYEDAIDAYRKAESIFRSLADEDESVKMAQNNIDVAIDRRAAKQELDEAPKELGKLDLRLAEAKGTEKERALQSRKAKRLKELVDVANRVDNFEKARAYAEQLADLASWLGDLGLQADASTAVGEAYYNLQKYSEAEKWHRKSFNYSQAIRSAEGMSVAMTNIGNCLDWLSQPEAALRAYQEGYKKAKEGNLLDQQITAVGNLLCVLERKKDSGDVKKWTKELQRLERLQKDQRRAGAAQKKRAEQSADEMPVRKSAPATGGVKPGSVRSARPGQESQSATANPVRKAAPADTVKAPPREPYKAERSEMDAYGIKPKNRVRYKSPPRKPKEAGRGVNGGDKGTEMRGTGGGARGAGTSDSRGVPERTDTTRSSGGGDVAAGKTATGAKEKRAETGQSPSGMPDRSLGKGAEDQPQKKQRREEASSAGGCELERKSVGGVSGEGERNEAPLQKESGAASRDGAAVKELQRKQRRRVIEEDDESDEEDSPMVVKRRRVETGPERAEKDELGRGLEVERSADEVNGRVGGRNASGTTAGREQKNGTKGADVPRPDSRESSQRQSDVTNARNAPGSAVPGGGRDRQTDRPVKTALTEITNRGPKAGPASRPAASKEVPRGTSSGAVTEDLLETQRVDPLTQMGDSEDPLEEEDFPDALPEIPVGFPSTSGEPGGRSKGSLGEGKGTPGGLAGARQGEKRPEETAGGRDAGPAGTRPVELNEHSSAGPATGTGRKSVASGKEATSRNTGSFRGSQAKSILVKIHGQTLKVIIRAQGDESPPKTVAWLIEEIVRLYSCDSVTGGSPIVRRLTHNGVSLKPIQIAEDVLGDLAPDEALEAHVDGWTRKPLLARYQAHCAALRQTPTAAVTARLASKLEAEEEVELPGCGLTDDSAGPLLAALEECESLTSLNLSQNALGNSTVHRIQELLASQPDLGFSLDLHHNQLGPGALTQLSRCPVVLSRLEVLDLSENRLTDAAGRHLATLLEKGSALMSLSLDNCGLTARTFTTLAKALRPGSPLTTLRIGHNNPVAGSALALLVEKLASLSSFSELDIAGVSVDPSAAAAIGRFLCRSQTLQTLSLAETNLRDAGAAALANALAAGEGATCCSLDLSSCHFTPLRAAPLCVQLARITALTSLSLRGNELGEQAASTLRRSISDTTSCLRQLDVSSCGLGAGTLVGLVAATAAAGSLEELRLAANCDSTDSNAHTSGEPSGNGGRRPTDGEDVVPESEEEDECEWKHPPRGSQRSNDSSKRSEGEKSDLGTGETGTLGSGAPKRPATGHGKEGANERGKGQGFDALLLAVRSAESLRVLDLSRNGLVDGQYKQLKEVFETRALQLEDCWKRGLLRRL